MNRRRHQLVVVKAEIPYTRYVLCESECKYGKKWKTCKRTSVIPHVLLRMRFANATKRIVPCRDWCEAGGWMLNFTGRKILDSPVLFECPDKLSQKKTGQQVVGMSEIDSLWIPQCCIPYRNRNVACAFGFACRITHTVYTESRL